MKKTLFLLPFTIISLTIFMFGCKEENISEYENPIQTEDYEEVKRNFFDRGFVSKSNPHVQQHSVSRNIDTIMLDTIIGLAAMELEWQDSIIPYISDLVNEIGYPAWDKAIMSYTSQQSTQIIVPFAFLDKDFTSSLLLVTLFPNGKIEYFIVHKSVIQGIAQKPDDYEDGRRYLPFLAMFYLIDEDIFGTADEDWMKLASFYPEIYRPYGSPEGSGRSCFTGWTEVVVCGWVPIFAYMLEYNCVHFNAPTYSDCIGHELQPIGEISVGIGGGGGGGGGSAPSPYEDCPQYQDSQGSNITNAPSPFEGHGTGHPAESIGSLYDKEKGKTLNIDLDAMFLIPGLPDCGGALTIDERKCLLENDQLLEEVTSLLDGTKEIRDVCGASTPDEIIQNVLSGICSGNASIESFYNTLESEYDYVILHEDFKNNPKMYCIYTNLFDNSGNLFCNTVGNFLDTDRFDLVLYVGSDPSTCARTYSDYPPGKISIIFDNSCIIERTEIQMVKTFLHEAIHAELYRIIKEIGGYDNLSPDNYPEIWEAYRTYKGWQHEYMAQEYVSQLAAALSIYDGASFAIDYYEALAWEGLDADPTTGHPISEVWDDKPQSEKNSILSKRQTLISSSSMDCN